LIVADLIEAPYAAAFPAIPFEDVLEAEVSVIPSLNLKFEFKLLNTK
jgi:hypothetical protein